MNNKAIYFIGGFIWALVSSRKAYAPNINLAIQSRNNPSKVLESGGKYTDAQLDAQYKRQMREFRELEFPMYPQVSDNPRVFKAESQADCPKGYFYISKNNCVTAMDLLGVVSHPTSS